MPTISQQGLLKRPARVFYGWWIVAVGFILDAVKEGTFSLGFATYFLPIQHELELSRTATSFAFTLGWLEGGLQGPLIGYLIDHLGPRCMEDWSEAIKQSTAGASPCPVGGATDLHCARARNLLLALLPREQEASAPICSRAS